MPLPRWLPVAAVLCAAASPVQGQVRFEPVAGLLFRNHMPARTLSNGEVVIRAHEVRRDAGPLIGIQVDMPVASRVSLVAAYSSARTAHATRIVLPDETEERFEGSMHVNLMSTQARVRVSPATWPLSLAVSAGPAYIANGSNMLSMGGAAWGAVGGATVGYRVNRTVSVLAHQEMYAYSRADAPEREHTFRLGVAFTPRPR